MKAVDVNNAANAYSTSCTLDRTKMTFTGQVFTGAGTFSTWVEMRTYELANPANTETIKGKAKNITVN